MMQNYPFVGLIGIDCEVAGNRDNRLYDRYVRNLSSRLAPAQDVEPWQGKRFLPNNDVLDVSATVSTHPEHLGVIMLS